MALRNYRALVEYDGTAYSGFQIQRDRPTIQGELECALQRITQQAVRIQGAGRTDAGVHAHGQVITFQTGWSHSIGDLERAMNAVLARDIVVRNVSVADKGFHARYSAWSRVYVYNIYSGRFRAPLLARYAHHVQKDLDLGSVRQAATTLKGEHDFAAFGQPSLGSNTVRVVHRVAWGSKAAVADGVSDPGFPEVLQFEIEANAFLRGMVRRIVGTLLLVGSGLLTVKEFGEILS